MSTAGNMDSSTKLQGYPSATISDTMRGQVCPRDTHSASRDFRFNLYEQKLTIFGRIYKLDRYFEELKNISVLYPEKTEFSKKGEYVQNIIEKNKVLYEDNQYVLVYTDIEDSESQLTKKHGFVKEPYKNNSYLMVKYSDTSYNVFTFFRRQIYEFIHA